MSARDGGGYKFWITLYPVWARQVVVVVVVVVAVIGHVTNQVTFCCCNRTETYFGHVASLCVFSSSHLRRSHNNKLMSRHLPRPKVSESIVRTNPASDTQYYDTQPRSSPPLFTCCLHKVSCCLFMQKALNTFISSKHNLMFCVPMLEK